MRNASGSSRMELMEVYRQILERGQQARAQYQKAKAEGAKGRAGELAEVAAHQADAYYWCAMMLEQTAEINPPLNKSGEQK